MGAKSAGSAWTLSSTAATRLPSSLGQRCRTRFLIHPHAALCSFYATRTGASPFRRRSAKAARRWSTSAFPRKGYGRGRPRNHNRCIVEQARHPGVLREGPFTTLIAFNNLGSDTALLSMSTAPQQQMVEQARDVKAFVGVLTHKSS